MTDIVLSFQSIIEQYLPEVYKIKKGRNEFVIFKKFYENIDSKPIQNWIDEIFVCDSVKDDERSKKLRENGNKFYKEKRYNEALEAYTESICFATPDGNEITLAYANRSAVLYTIKEFENSLLDIENCLRTNYPEMLKYKVYIRQANCYLNLNRREDVIQTILKIRKCLNDLQEFGLEQNKIDVLLKEIIEIEKSIEMPMDKLMINEMNGNDIIQLPELRDGPNDKFLYASAAIDLRYEKSKGRHVVANRKINTGDVLFVEKPFTFVPTIPEVKESIYLLPRCYNCHKLTKTSIPCNFCAVLYCSMECSGSAWNRYHQWECKGCCVEFWPKIGIGYMAIRLTLLGAGSGYSNVSRNPEEDVNNYGDSHDNYKYISKLITNIDKVDQHTQLSNIIGAIMLALYLRFKTDFFNYLRTIPNIPSGDDDELIVLVGGILMRHLSQVVANASVIEDVSMEFIEKFDTSEKIISDGYYVRAAGIYPSVSMMNHSCDTNITYHFCDDYMVVRARRVIDEGDEVLNSYGYDFRKYDTEERKLNLSKQYYFECKCNACSYPTKPEMFRNGLLCQICNGCALEDGQYFKCLECTHVFSPKNHFLYIVKAEKLYKKYKETNNVEYLEKCLEIRSKAFYKHNKNILSINMALQHHYASLGYFRQWWDLAQMVLEMDQVMLGRDYLQYAVNLRTTIYNIIQHLMKLSLNRVNNVTRKELIDLIAKLKLMITEMKELFILFYPDNILSFDTIDNQFNDITAIVARIIERNLFKYDQNENNTQQCVNYINSVI